MQRQEAEEHLRIIRSLMEKATVYRAIAAPTALVAGLLALLAAYVGARMEDGPEENIIGHDLQGMGFRFIALWGGVLAVVAALNAWFLYADARRRGEKFISSGMKMALMALLPSHLTAFLLTVLFTNNIPLLTTCWCVMHGLGLLATSHFSPRSMIYLGWAFLTAGFIALIHVTAVPSFPQPDFYWLSFGNFSMPFFSLPTGVSPHALMAVTFGAFHLIYAACTWPRGAVKASV